LRLVRDSEISGRGPGCNGLVTEIVVRPAWADQLREEPYEGGGVPARRERSRDFGQRKLIGHLARVVQKSRDALRDLRLSSLGKRWGSFQFLEDERAGVTDCERQFKCSIPGDRKKHALLLAHEVDQPLPTGIVEQARYYRWHRRRVAVDALKQGHGRSLQLARQS
jgi:hypothetical protein